MQFSNMLVAIQDTILTLWMLGNFLKIDYIVVYF